MGLFSKKCEEPLVHADVGRSIYLPAPPEAVVDRLSAYSDLQSPRHAGHARLRLASGSGWTRVELPSALHPWTFHNLAFWLLDTPGGGEGTLAVSDPGPDHAGYVLVRDPEIGDCLCGVDDVGDGWTVSVPTNDIVRPEPVPAVAAVPLVDGWEPFTELEVLVEDPGRDMNPSNAATVRTRKRLDRTDVMTIY